MFTATRAFPSQRISSSWSRTRLLPSCGYDLYPLPFLNRGRGLGDSPVVHEDPAPVDEVLCGSDAQVLQLVGHAPGQAKAAGGAVYAEADGPGAEDVLSPAWAFRLLQSCGDCPILRAGLSTEPWLGSSPERSLAMSVLDPSSRGCGECAAHCGAGKSWPGSLPGLTPLLDPRVR